MMMIMTMMTMMMMAMMKIWFDAPLACNNPLDKNKNFTDVTVSAILVDGHHHSDGKQPNLLICWSLGGIHKANETMNRD